jgi:hypothetical protein
MKVPLRRRQTEGQAMEFAALLNVASTLALVGALIFAGLQIRA